ncbi:AAA family ATPase [Kitasatospora sp. NPDC056184]|uniref:AAA family ATPase n=1 Tax=Kitasatospora sp. NPDC056184 TaxID=3345738 RepID=UPI0035DE3775
MADTVGVSVRTVWRWLAEANATGEVDGKPARQGYTMSDRTWALLAAAGGNVAELHRRMLASGEEGVPPLGTLHRVVRRDRLAGRVLVIEREPGLAEPLRTDPLAELGLATVSGAGLGGQVFLREQTRLAAVLVLVPGAQVVVTSVVASVVQRVAHVAADLTLLEALRRPRVLVLDEAQRLPAAALEFLRQLWDHPDTDVALLFAGAGSERALRRVPALASRVLTWELVPRLSPAEVGPVMEAFHPLWGQVAPGDVAWVEEHVGHGNFRTWAKVTSHLTAEVYGQARPVVDRRLLERVCARLTGPL